MGDVRVGLLWSGRWYPQGFLIPIYKTQCCCETGFGPFGEELGMSHRAGEYRDRGVEQVWG